MYHPVALLLGHRWVFYFRQAMRRTVDGRDPTQVLYLHRLVTLGGAPITQLALPFSPQDHTVQSSFSARI